jgi:hypothetical protein
MEDSDGVLILDIILEFAWRSWGKLRKPSVRKKPVSGSGFEFMTSGIKSRKYAH